MNPKEIEERSERFKTEYSDKLSGLSPEITENPAFEDIVEFYLAPKAYATGDYTWGTVRDELDGPKRSPMLPHEVTVKVSKDGKKLVVIRNAAPLKVAGSQFDARQASIAEVVLNDDGTITYTESTGELAPSNDGNKDNLHTTYMSCQYDKQGNQILAGYLQSKTYVNRRELNDVVQHTLDHQPGFSSYYGIVEKGYSFYGDLEQAYIISRETTNLADNKVLVVEPMKMTSSSRYISSDYFHTKTFRVADFNDQHPRYFSSFALQTAGSGAYSSDSSPFVLDFNKITKPTHEDWDRYYAKVKEIQQSAIDRGTLRVENDIESDRAK